MSDMRDEFEKWMADNVDDCDDIGSETLFQCWQAARAQGGQDAEVEPAAYLLLWPDGSPWGAVNSQSTVEMWMKRADEGRTVKPLYTEPQPAVPEGWRIAVQRAVDELSIMDDSEGIAGFHLNGDVSPWDEGELPSVRAELQALLSTPTTPQADGWVRCEDRLPAEADADSEGNVWFCWPDGDMWLAHYKKIQLPYHSEHHWMPTGLKRPQPPAGQEGA